MKMKLLLGILIVMVIASAISFTLYISSIIYFSYISHKNLKNKKKLTPYEISKINSLKKRKKSIKKLCKKSVNGISKDDEKMLETIDKAISNLEYDTSITRHDISLSDDIIKIIDSLIDLFSMEYMYKDIIIQKKIEIINIDKIIKYVSENTFKALNPRIFETESVYSKDFLMDYIAKKSKVFVMTYVMKYNIEISLR